MIGPQAYENLFYCPSVMKECSYIVNGIRYTYSHDYEILSMFESVERYRQWCFEDIMYNKGEFADRREVVA